MKVWFNDQARPDLEEAPHREVLEAAEAEAARTGSVITSVTVDDAEISPETFPQLSGGLSARFTLVPLRSLVKETLEEAQGYLPRLEEGLLSIAKAFGDGDPASAQSLLADALDGLDWLLTVCRSCVSLMGSPLLQSRQDAFEEGLLLSLNVLMAQGEAGDFRGMADTLKDELLPKLRPLSDTLNELLKARNPQ